MTFSRETWQAAVHKKLQEVGRWLNQHQQEEMPYAIYGTVAGLALWPLVETAVHAPHIAPLIGTIYSIATGTGAATLATQIETWQKQPDPPTETEICQWVIEQVPADDDLKQALDAILQWLNALSVAYATLTEEAQRQFSQQLQAEMTQLGNLESYQATLIGSGVVAQGTSATAVAERGVAVQGNVGGSVITDKVEAGGDFSGRDKITVYAEQGAKVIIGQEPEAMPAVDRQSALGRYLAHLIAHNRHLQLQGIRSGGRLVHIELERIYITLRTTQQRTIQAEEQWLAQQTQLAPGEQQRLSQADRHETVTVTVTVNEALKAHARLAILGDPGSGKTTLLRYLALMYARELSGQTDAVTNLIGQAEAARLPILLPLRQLGLFLKEHAEASTEGHRLLLQFLQRYLQNERIEVPLDFFDPYLAEGQAVILLDGLDEVAGTDLRRRVSRLVERFTQAYPACRFIVTSRIVGYSGAARLAEDYTTTTVQDFTLADVEQFLSYWHRLVFTGQMGAGPAAVNAAQQQTQQLMSAVRTNERIRELAINPLMLTVIALVHRDRVKLPDRRAELYAEAVDVLLGKWDEARGVVAEQPLLPDRPFDTTDRRLLLQSVALHMHEQQQKEIEGEALRDLLHQLFVPLVADAALVDKAVGRFLRLIEERTGLLVARGDGVYTFSHLTFQEYLAALAVAARDDYVTFTLARSGETWWREVILLETGHLSLLSKERTSRLVAAIANNKAEPVRYHNLVLASECLRDVGEGRVDQMVTKSVSQRLRADLDAPLTSSRLSRLFKNEKQLTKEWIEQRSTAMNALVRAGAGYWTQPFGEPEWLEIPAGAFTMGEEQEAHQVHLPAYAIAQVPVANAQYLLFVAATGHDVPKHWVDSHPPKGLESHPVVYVSWYDALAYCDWLSQMTGKSITLPSEAEWEKAARGSKDARVYPWGDTFDRLRCNTSELGIQTTTPVGIFPDGASPYSVLDMSGNVWEWTRSLSQSYPYQAEDGRENMVSTGERVLRGGSWYYLQYSARAAARNHFGPGSRINSFGFRVVVRRPPSHGL